jgi:hypothetical protein
MKIYSKQILGLVLLVIGLLTSVGSWNLVLSYPNQSSYFEFREYVVPHNRVLFPDSFALYKVPDYLLRYLIIGVFTTAVGITIVASPLLKRLAGIEDE